MRERGIVNGWGAPGLGRFYLVSLGIRKPSSTGEGGSTLIAVGIKNDTGHTTTWYGAHSLNRHSKGHIVVYGNDPKTRIPYRVPMRLFHGVRAGDEPDYRGVVQELPTIEDWAGTANNV